MNGRQSGCTVRGTRSIPSTKRAALPNASCVEVERDSSPWLSDVGRANADDEDETASVARRRDELALILMAIEEEVEGGRVQSTDSKGIYSSMIAAAVSSRDRGGTGGALGILGWNCVAFYAFTDTLEVACAAVRPARNVSPAPKITGNMQFVLPWPASSTYGRE